MEVPSAHDPDWPLRVALSVLEISERFGFGAPLGEEYAATGWHSQFADRAQDFERGTIYLDTATGHAGFWRRRDPIASSPPGSPEGPVSDGRVGSSERGRSA